MTLTQIKPAGLSKPVDFADNEKIRLGTGNDLEIFHDGTNSGIQNAGGGLYITTASTGIFLRKGSSEELARFNVDGAVELYHDNVKKFETASHGVTFFGTSFHGDNIVSAFGASSDLQIYHDGTNSVIKDTGTGNLQINLSGLRINDAANNEKILHANENGAVELYYDNSKKAETDSFGFEVLGELRVTGGSYGNTHFNYLDSGNNYINQGNSSTTQFRNASATVRTQIEASGNWTWKDNIKVQVGDSQDLQIYHDGTNSYIANNNGALYITQHNNDIYLRPKTSEEGIIIHNDGAVDLYHNGSIRAYTASDGFALSRVNTFPNPNNTGSEITGALLDIGGNLHLEERYPNGAYADRQDLVLRTNTGYGQGLSDKIRFQSNGDIQLLVSGTGINFHPQGASAANLLDDYEEGTWTPSVHNGGGSITSTVVARYTKIGRLVHIQAYINYSAGSSTNAFQMGGLPFACLGNDYNTCVADFGKGGKKGAYSRTHTGNTFMEFLYSSESASTDRITLKGNQIGTGYIIVSNTYMTS